MKTKLIITALVVLPAIVFAQTSPNLVGAWKGVGNASVSGPDNYHPTEAGKEKSVRFTKMEFFLVVDREEGRNFTGYISSTSSKAPANTDNKKMIIGSYAKDMKSGVWINELGGSATFKLADSKNLEICYTQVPPKPMVADCFEMVKQ
jgi:hypothetical protein